MPHRVGLNSDADHVDEDDGPQKSAQRSGGPTCSASRRSSRRFSPYAREQKAPLMPKVAPGPPTTGLSSAMDDLLLAGPISSRTRFRNPGFRNRPRTLAPIGTAREVLAADARMAVAISQTRSKPSRRKAPPPATLACSINEPPVAMPVLGKIEALVSWPPPSTATLSVLKAKASAAPETREERQMRQRQVARDAVRRGALLDPTARRYDDASA